jgi:hypothetical protein
LWLSQTSPVRMLQLRSWSSGLHIWDLRFRRRSRSRLLPSGLWHHVVSRIEPWKWKWQVSLKRW